MANVSDNAPTDTGYSARPWLWLSVLVAMADQATKFLAEWYLEPLRPLSLLPSFNLMLTYNRGAAFSFLGNAGGWQRYFFILVTLAVLVFLLRWLWRLPPRQGLVAAGLSLLIGGAVGNFIDRVATGQVVDFLDLYYGAWHWPAFNLADSAITVGVTLLVVDALFVSGKNNNTKYR